MSDQRQVDTSETDRGQPEAPVAPRRLFSVVTRGAHLFDTIGKYSILVAILTFLWNSLPFSSARQDQKKQLIYQAWGVIANASRSGGSGGVAFALRDLIDSKQSLEGISLNNISLAAVDFSTTRALPTISFNRGACKKCVFSGLDMRGGSLANSDFSDSTFRETNLRHSNLSNSNFTNAILTEADFTDLEPLTIGLATREEPPTILDGVRFTGATIDSAKFEHASLKRASLDEAHGIGADFSSASMDDAILSSGNFEGAKFIKTSLVGAIFAVQNPKKRGTRLVNADLRGANLQNANLSPASLSIIVLMGAAAAGRTNVDLDAISRSMSVDLRGANLIGTDFSNAKMTGVILIDAKIGSDRPFGKTNFSGADLREAVGLTRTQIEQAITNEKTMLPASLSDTK